MLAFIFTIIYVVNATAQNWSLLGNNDATAASKLGTINSQPVRIFVKNAEKMRVDSQGRVGIGISDPLSLLSLRGNGGTPVPSWLANTFPLITGFAQNTTGNGDIVLGMASSAGVGFPRLVGRKARGTLIAPTIVNINDRLLSIIASGHDGVDMQDAASIEFVVDKNPTAGRVPGRIVFSTSANGSNRLERLRIGNNGDFTFNTNQLFLEKTTGALAMGSILPDTSALLDMSSTTRGVLTPRMTTSQKNSIPKPAFGLLIYQTDSVPGFYYFNNGWLNLTTSDVAANAANKTLSNLTAPTAVNQTLLPGINNDVSLGRSTQNWKDIFMSGSIFNGTVKVFNADLVMDNLAIGSNALISTTIGTENTAIGTNALKSNTEGLLNTAVGFQALSLSTTGSANTAVGDNALTRNKTGGNNTAIGRLGLSENTTGNDNTSLGSDALSLNTEGNNNTGLGGGSLSDNTTGNDNTAIGRGALAFSKSGSTNTAVGKGSMERNLTGFSNIAIGVKTLFNNNIGSNLVAVGDSALFNQNGGDGFNTAIGSKTLFANTTGANNTATGFQALRSNLTGNSNTANGSNALTTNTTGRNNTANGSSALFSNTIGIGNTAVGTSSLFNNIDGNSNTAVGSNVLSQLLTGSGNSAFGSGAMNKSFAGDNNTALGTNTLTGNSGFDNTSVGAKAMTFNSTGSQNTAVGESALFNNTKGSENTAIGDSAMYSNTTANGNVALGFRALSLNTSGDGNTALGRFTLLNNTIGLGNTAVGVGALIGNTIGSVNIATGSNALSKNTTGNFNSAYGALTLFNNTTGNFNAAFGDSALLTNITGNSNTALGNSANVSTSALSNATVIGNRAVVNASNKMQLGSSITTLATTGGITIVSDGRFKDKVNAKDVPGLEFINNLKPVTYNFNYKNYDDFLRKEIRKSNPSDATDKNYQELLQQKSEVREIGFIAQEVNNLVKDKGYTFNGVYTPQNSNDNYALDYSRFVVPLVKAVQELSIENARLLVGQGKLKVENEKIGAKAAKVDDLQKQIDELRDAMMKLINQPKCVPTSSK